MTKKMCPQYHLDYDAAKCSSNECLYHLGQANIHCEIKQAKKKDKVMTRQVFTHPDIAITTNPMFWGALNKSKTYCMPVTISWKAKDWEKLRSKK
jgi:hypothetical protein